MRNVQSGVTSRKQHGQAKKAPQFVENVAADTAKWLSRSNHPLWGSLFSEECYFEPVAVFCISPNHGDEPCPNPPYNCTKSTQSTYVVIVEIFFRISEVNSSDPPFGWWCPGHWWSAAVSLFGTFQSCFASSREAPPCFQRSEDECARSWKLALAEAGLEGWAFR